jgi:hypothetical protein
MSHPEYPTFSKKCQRRQRNSRGTYNFEKTNEYHLAERWFEERREVKKEERPPSPMVQSPPPKKKIIGPPPGLPIPSTIYYPKVQKSTCVMCNTSQTNYIISSCCSSFLCFNCNIIQSDVYNRCCKCNAIIDMKKYREYEDLDLKIPSYDEFDYVSPEEAYNLSLYNSKNKIPVLNVLAEEFIPTRYSNQQKTIMENQLCMNYIMLYNFLSSYS